MFLKYFGPAFALRIEESHCLGRCLGLKPLVESVLKTCVMETTGEESRGNKVDKVLGELIDSQ